MMIHYDAKERWTIDKVLESDWLKEIDNLSEDEEKKIKKELGCIYQKVRTSKEVLIDFKIKKYNFSVKALKNDKIPTFTN